ncbi:MAG: DUF3108 domain-containing protein, partial [Gemmatirosa sp.]|nr:DUF3108 domain-containing protein [Gemmatirosa sp.]
MPQRTTENGRTAHRIGSAVLLASVVAAIGLPAQAPAPGAPGAPGASGASSAAGGARLPFFVGETLSYRVRVGRMGNVGRTTMIVDTAQTLRGTPAWVLRFDFHAKVGPIGAVDRTESWLDPVRLTALRFRKHERHPLSKHDERVELDPDAHRWIADDGTTGVIASDAPLDELSFMYVLRTLPLGDSASVTRYVRHFDPARNPTLVRVL